ncbi:PhoH family protein [Neobittarella massiliensis]|uniref:PhoH-like protein n=1 Tax=uncultured Anaerotruncus sp. TaxID=905011 RepID=A0A1C6H1W6_9FIRM|nr:PhoH family protein [Neobittarella massiliensis]SCJ51619.1 PhoH-like protein [uncultured Anaerotruncus sp.]
MEELLLEGCTPQQLAELFGRFDENVKQIERRFGVRITSHDGAVRLDGDEVQTAGAKKAIENLLLIQKSGTPLDDQNVRYSLELAAGGDSQPPPVADGDIVCLSAKGRPIKAKTFGQKKYVEAIAQNSVVFGIGPAGTGKTYLAVAMAVKAFRAGEVEKIILTRPAVEAGEKLGFLPGDLQMKVDPYLRPLYDALFDMLGAETFYKYQERGNIEVAPLAYMRGRTLNESFIILDEAQNTTPEQMKMFLTRLGAGSKAVVTGDITQIDLPDSRQSGLVVAARIVRDVEDIAQIYFTEKDVVRHRLVMEIIRAYERYYQKQENKKARSPEQPHTDKR